MRTTPAGGTFETFEEGSLAWLGRAAATLERWNRANPACVKAVQALQSGSFLQIPLGLSTLKTLLHQARADLRMEVGQTSVVVQQGRVFEYFDELRKLVETARVEAFFVDPYLDADFVARYLPSVASGVAVRLLGAKKIGALLPAVDLFAKQSQLRIEVRSSAGLHDRYLFVDRAACYQSGASFKDGAKNAPVTLTQINDAFEGDVPPAVETSRRLGDDYAT